MYLLDVVPLDTTTITWKYWNDTPAAERFNMEKPSGGLAAPLELKVNSHDRKAGRKARVPLSCGPCRYRK
jgi:hypothetical protein